MKEKRTIPPVDEKLLDEIVPREKNRRAYEIALQTLRDHRAKQDAGLLTEEPSEGVMEAREIRARSLCDEERAGLCAELAVEAYYRRMFRE